MRSNAIPSCYFPSTVLFVNDCQDYLKQYVLELDNVLPYRLVDSPFDALDILLVQRQESAQNKLPGHDYVEETSFEEQNGFSSIHDEVYNSQRFSEISVVVIDNANPGMNGIDFCERLKSCRVMRLLLVDAKDERMAKDALADGMVDSYLKKGGDHYERDLAKSIESLQINYFKNTSTTLEQIVKTSFPSCLNDPTFVRFFNKMIDEHEVIEFYMLDQSGSFLMLNKQAKAMILVVRTIDDIRRYRQEAVQNKLSSEIFSELDTEQKLPVYSVESHSSQDWLTYLLSAQRLQGEQTYFYAVTNEVAMFDVRQDSILSFKHFLTHEGAMIMGTI